MKFWIAVKHKLRSKKGAILALAGMWIWCAIDHDSYKLLAGSIAATITSLSSSFLDP
jgi:hypothetical protein